MPPDQASTRHKQAARGATRGMHAAMADDTIARHVTIHGRVQGVWFRDTTRHHAAERGVAGWVRNRSDGAVEAWFEGPADAVEAVVAWCHEGPARADVSRVDVEDEQPRGLTDFSVR